MWTFNIIPSSSTPETRHSWDFCSSKCKLHFFIEREINADAISQADFLNDWWYENVRYPKIKLIMSIHVFSVREKAINNLYFSRHGFHVGRKYTYPHFKVSCPGCRFYFQSINTYKSHNFCATGICWCTENKIFTLRMITWSAVPLLDGYVDLMVWSLLD